MTNRAVRTTLRSSFSPRSRRKRPTAQTMASKLHRNFSRRSFLSVAAGAAAALTLSNPAGGQTTRPTEQRTLYFDFSYLPDPTVPIIAVIADAKYPLKHVAQASPAAQRKMQSHKLLQALPPGTATHVLENVSFPADAVQGGYFMISPDFVAGSFLMLPMFLGIPTTAATAALVITMTSSALNDVPSCEAVPRTRTVSPA